MNTVTLVVHVSLLARRCLRRAAADSGSRQRTGETSPDRTVTRVCSHEVVPQLVRVAAIAALAFAPALPRVSAASAGEQALTGTAPLDTIAAPRNPPPQERKPNVILLLTDDQGYGDLSCHGNPVIKTPAMDNLHRESVCFDNFHAAPICTPSRSQLMTGRDALANGAYCVCSGHGFIRQDLPTMPAIFASNGYRTGIFGKWHLGENVPYRPQDRGFQEVVSFRGYGTQAAANRWNNEPADQWWLHNETWEQSKGYCTDALFVKAMAWMKRCVAEKQPFLAYLPTTAVHAPFLISEEYRNRYPKLKPEQAAFAGTLANLDENLARLETFLIENKLKDDTILIFLSDNGTYGGYSIHNAGMKGAKGSYDNGGHRVPCFIRWPNGRLRPPGETDTLTEMQDILPTLIDLCGLLPPAGVSFDGSSLARVLRGQEDPGLAARMCVVQCSLWNEYLHPRKWEGAVLWNRWLLVKGRQLYNLRDDPGQQAELSAKYPDVLSKMRNHYEKWWDRTEPLAREYQPIHLGSALEPVAILTSDNWVAPNSSDQVYVRAGEAACGVWHVLVERSGDYEISLRRWPLEADLPLSAAAPAFDGRLMHYPAGAALPITGAKVKIAGQELSRQAGVNDRAVVFEVPLRQGRAELLATFHDESGTTLCGAYYVHVRFIKRSSR